jgi:hypothetical protein
MSVYISKSGKVFYHPKNMNAQNIWKLLPYKTCSGISDKFIADFEQASNCFKSGYYDAAVVMYRRTLERVLREKTGQSWLELRDMICQLADQGKIPREMRGLCGDLRVLGNRGAHPVKAVDQDDAETATQFTDILLTWLYSDVKPTKESLGNKN